MWVTPARYARDAGISPRDAQRKFKAAHVGAPIGGVAMVVRIVRGGRGGKAGVRYEAWMEPDLADAQLPAVIERPSATTDRLEHAVQRFDAVVPALKQRARSIVRGAAINKIADDTGLHPSTVRRIVKAAAKGVQALARKTRSDAGSRRYRISAALDVLMNGLRSADELHSKIEKMRDSIWAAGAAGHRSVARKLTPLVKNWLHAALAEAGIEIADDELHRVCRLPRSFIDGRPREQAEGRGRGASVSAKYRRDHAHRYNRLGADVTRSFDHLEPNELWELDVHPCDDDCAEDDGRRVWPRAIGIYDVATKRYRESVAALPKGRAVRNEDIAEAFIAAVLDWGLPQRLRLDNGPEFNCLEFVKMLLTLNQWAARAVEIDAASDLARSPISRTIPRRPRGKEIEPVFGRIEAIMSEYPEHRGGDRLNQRVPVAGKKGPALRFDDWVERRGVAVTTYNATPQHGRLGGLSPNEYAHRRGWPKVECPREILECVFARDDTRKITRGAFSWKGDDFYHERLQRLSGKTLTLRVPISRPLNRIWVRLASGKGLWAERKPVFAENDPAGARWQNVQWAVLRGEIAEIEARTEPVDMQALDARANIESPAPAPQIVGRVQASDDIETAAAALAALPAPKPKARGPFIDDDLERWRTRRPAVARGGK